MSDGPCRLLSMRVTPAALDERRRERIATAFETKTGKLAAAERKFAPADIYVVETDRGLLPWLLWILRTGRLLR